MKSNFSKGVVNSRYLISIFLTAFTLVAPLKNASAQGWSFTVSVEVSGPCGSYTPVIPIPTITNMPTQSYCESLRQSLISISYSQPMYDSYGNFLGNCVAYVACTPCSGSDISTSAGSEFGTGDVSIDGLLSGTPFFSPHNTQELENWTNDYLTKLQAMGINFNLDNNYSAQNIPLTGIPDFDQFYVSQLADFEKYGLTGTNVPVNKDVPVPPAAPVVTTPPPVVTPEETGYTVAILRTQADIDRENKWLEEHDYFNLSQVGSNNTMDDGGNEKPQMSYTEAAIREYVGDNIAGNFALKVADGVTSGITDVVNMMSSGDMEGAAEKAKNLDRNVAYNSAIETGKDAITGAVTGAVTSPVLGLVKGAGVVSTLVNGGVNVWNTVHGK